MSFTSKPSVSSESLRELLRSFGIDADAAQTTELPSERDYNLRVKFGDRTTVLKLSQSEPRAHLEVRCLLVKVVALKSPKKGSTRGVGSSFPASLRTFGREKLSW